MFGSAFSTAISHPNGLFSSYSEGTSVSFRVSVKNHRAFETRNTIPNEHLSYVWIFLGLQSHCKLSENSNI